MAASVRELFPQNRPTDTREAYGQLGLAQLASDHRPYVVANMVSSADGSATLAGRSAGISSETDRELFHELRTQVDAVMVGTRTIATENYGALVRSDELRQRRVDAGLQPSPVAITATRSLALPMDAPLLADPSTRVIVLTNSSASAPDCAAQLDLLRTPGDRIDFETAFEHLRTEYSVRTILLEGGPTLLGAVVSAGLLDELFLTISPLIAGAGETQIVETDALTKPPRLELESVLESEGALFLRYRISG